MKIADATSLQSTCPIELEAAPHVLTTNIPRFLPNDVQQFLLEIDRIGISIRNLKADHDRGRSTIRNLPGLERNMAEIDRVLNLFNFWRKFDHLVKEWDAQVGILRALQDKLHAVEEVPQEECER